MRKKQWDGNVLAGLEDVILNSECERYKGRWREIFQEQNALSSPELPIHLEIGVGKGKFIAELAEKNLGKVNFIGLEARSDVLYYAAKKIKVRLLPNIRLLAVNANQILDLFAEGEIERIYINFCDPWPKKRHAKRRLTCKSFLEKYKIILPPGGEIFFKTDNEELFEFSLNEFANFGAKIRNISLNLHKNKGSNYGNENILTEYETKFINLCMKIYRAEFVFA